MCGIVGAVAQRDVVPILVEGLHRLEYRGYDSAGVAVLGGDAGCLERTRMTGKVAGLEAALAKAPLAGSTGIAHTRWATHGPPSESNAHPHLCRERVGLVHNGIIENFEALRAAQGDHEFDSDTDTEVVVHRVHDHLAAGLDLLAAVQATVAELEGAYALGVVAVDEPGRLVAARRGSPLVIGLGIGENFIASDVMALLPVTQRFMFLEEGDIADLRRDGVTVYDATGAVVERAVSTSELAADAVERGHYRHYMIKEIHEQPRALADTLEGRIGGGRLLEQAFGPEAAAIFDNVRAVQIVACGTSFHAGSVARYWMEALAGLPCWVEVASEFRYRRHVVPAETLFVTISQSGETADTLAALRAAKELGYAHSLAICNVPESSLVRESELVLMTRAGPEIGVASTKAFTTQLVALLLLVIALGRRHRLDEATERNLVGQLLKLPGKVEHALELDAVIAELAESFADKHHALFLGRGDHYPVALEGALKLKEISYVHAEGYAAGEMKHGPIALIDPGMTIVCLNGSSPLDEKMRSNVEQVKARGGVVLSVGSDAETHALASDVVEVPATHPLLAPILNVIPLQLFSYFVADLRGCDIDKPRNLAKSVTVE